MNDSMGRWFGTTGGVRQGYFLSPTLSQVSIGCRNITNLRCADNIKALAEEAQELKVLLESLNKISTRYKMVISAEKNRLMTNSVNGIQKEIKLGK